MLPRCPCPRGLSAPRFFGVWHFQGTVSTDSSSIAQCCLRNIPSFCWWQQPPTLGDPLRAIPLQEPQAKVKEGSRKQCCPKYGQEKPDSSSLLPCLHFSRNLTGSPAPLQPSTANGCELSMGGWQESYNHLGWKRPLRSSNSTIHPALLL